MQTTKRATGPFDKRKRSTRCLACAKRRIKCEGGCPCKYCIRTRKTCEPQKPTPNTAKFVAVTGNADQTPTTQLVVKVRKPAETLYLEFFALFMQRCQFTKGFASATTDLVSLMQGCSALREVAMAIGALDASRRGSASSFHGSESPGCAAFTLYGRSIQALRTQLAETASHGDDVLWSTFFMGLFELMSQTLADRWSRHMCHGLSRMLQLAGPAKTWSSLHWTFFDAFRVMEASRAIMYGDGTFLSQDAWLHYHPNPASEMHDQSDPMQSILTLVIQTAAFSRRFSELLGRIPEPNRSTDPTIDALVHEGFHIQHTIHQWRDDNASQHLDTLNPYAQVAMASHWALELLLCRNYTLYSCWDGRAVPRLEQGEKETHVASILDLAEKVLGAGTLAGALLLFPLRMAGANTVKAEEQSRVLDLLEQIYRSGFMVTDRIKEDVQKVWAVSGRTESSLQLE